MDRAPGMASAGGHKRAEIANDRQFPMLSLPRGQPAWPFHAMKTYDRQFHDRERTRPSSTPTGRRSAVWRPRSPMRCAGAQAYLHPARGHGDCRRRSTRKISGDGKSGPTRYTALRLPGGLKTRTLDEMLDRRPEEVLRLAVKGMLPRNRLARKQLTKLKILRRAGASARGPTTATDGDPPS